MPEPFATDLMGLVDSTRTPSKPFFAPPDFLIAIGLLVLSWDSFDRSIDALLFALTSATSAPFEDTGNDFRKRKRQIRKLSKQVFHQHAAIENYITSILDDTAKPYWVRNFVVHSHVWLKIQTGEVTEDKIPGSVSLTCIKAKKGRTTLRADFSLSDLQEAVYDLGYLAGRLEALCTNSAALVLSLPDRSFLEEFLKKDYRSSSISPI